MYLKNVGDVDYNNQLVWFRIFPTSNEQNTGELGMHGLDEFRFYYDKELK